MVKDNPALTPQPARRRWAIWLPAALAVTGAVLFILVDEAGLIMGSWDTPAPGLGWLRAGVAGQVLLAAAALATLITGMTSARWHRTAVVTGWVIVAVGCGWFLVTTLLARSS
jgi:hypothetical protein